MEKISPQKKYWQRWSFWLNVLWFAIPLIACFVKITLDPGSYNNYLIYKHVFWHVWQGEGLYDFYPEQYHYQNHYGPTFSLVIAPFALMPDKLGILLWGAANCLVLFLAIRQLPLEEKSKQAIMLISLLELSGTVQIQQFNPMLCGWIILSFVMMYKDRIPAAALLISGGILVKLYGVVGVLFTPFHGKYRKIVLWMIVAMLLLICLPMLFSGPSFIVHQYEEWYLRLLGKNQENISTNLNDGMQDLSFMGMVRRISGYTGFSNLWFLIPGGILTLLPLLRKACLGDRVFQLRHLAQVLIAVVIFSTSSESPTYIIAVTGFAIWFASHEVEKPLWLKMMLVLLFLLTILSYTDLYPPAIRNAWIKRYALKALPCVLAWMIITVQLLRYRPVVHDR